MRPGHRPPSRRRGRRHRRQPGQSGTVLLRQRGDGHPRDRRESPGRRRETGPGRHRVRVPEVHSGPFQGRRPVEWLSGGNQRSLRHRQEIPARHAPGLPRSSTDSTASSCCRSTCTDPGQLRSRDQPRHPGPDPEVRHSAGDRRRHVEVWGTGSASREFLYVEDAARAIVLATKAYDGPEPVNIGTHREITIRDLVTLIGELTGFEGEIRWDTTKARRSTAPHARHDAGAGVLWIRG